MIFEEKIKSEELQDLCFLQKSDEGHGKLCICLTTTRLTYLSAFRLRNNECYIQVCFIFGHPQKVLSSDYCGMPLLKAMQITHLAAAGIEASQMSVRARFIILDKIGNAEHVIQHVLDIFGSSSEVMCFSRGKSSQSDYVQFNTIAKVVLGAVQGTLKVCLISRCMSVCCS